ncbi:myb-like protein F isoform X1 [Leptidea sinapis]|uniref:myb-like protein F isoform X1 n=1 Tax=Leptidea sinapis TaxID=189913 RepID=UPI0021C28147|nr:myb-like protein F isoform X1 [Leptidea sinapis]XP_050665114.1 myb-like protein F isoform X1 [Leptidea sinapis]XP_050665115.1 myb-like protein F isoform X1 [Leptidea sinapis]
MLSSQLYDDAQCADGHELLDKHGVLNEPLEHFSTHEGSLHLVKSSMYKDNNFDTNKMNNEKLTTNASDIEHTTNKNNESRLSTKEYNQYFLEPIERTKNTGQDNKKEKPNGFNFYQNHDENFNDGDLPIEQLKVQVFESKLSIHGNTQNENNGEDMNSNDMNFIKNRKNFLGKDINIQSSDTSAKYSSGENNVFSTKQFEIEAFKRKSSNQANFENKDIVQLNDGNGRDSMTYGNVSYYDSKGNPQTILTSAESEVNVHESRNRQGSNQNNIKDNIIRAEENNARSDSDFVKYHNDSMKKFNQYFLDPMESKLNTGQDNNKEKRADLNSYQTNDENMNDFPLDKPNVQSMYSFESKKSIQANTENENNGYFMNLNYINSIKNIKNYSKATLQDIEALRTVDIYMNAHSQNITREKPDNEAMGQNFVTDNIALKKKDTNTQSSNTSAMNPAGEDKDFSYEKFKSEGYNGKSSNQPNFENKELDQLNYEIGRDSTSYVNIGYYDDSKVNPQIVSTSGELEVNINESCSHQGSYDNNIKDNILSAEENNTGSDFNFVKYHTDSIKSSNRLDIAHSVIAGERVRIDEKTGDLFNNPEMDPNTIKTSKELFTEKTQTKLNDIAEDEGQILINSSSDSDKFQADEKSKLLHFTNIEKRNIAQSVNSNNELKFNQTTLETWDEQLSNKIDVRNVSAPTLNVSDTKSSQSAANKSSVSIQKINANSIKPDSIYKVKHGDGTYLLPQKENEWTIPSKVDRNLGRISSQSNRLKDFDRKPSSSSSRDRECHNSRGSSNAYEEKLFGLDFAIQMNIDKKNKKIFKTIDSTNLPPDTDSIIALKSKIRINDDQLKIPIDADTDIVLQIIRKDKKENNILSLQSNQGTFNLDTQKDLQQSGTIQEILTSIYEQNLIPVENLLHDLREEVDILTQNQSQIQTMLSGKKIISMKLNNNVKRCGCPRRH